MVLCDCAQYLIAMSLSLIFWLLSNPWILDVPSWRGWGLEVMELRLGWEEKNIQDEKMSQARIFRRKSRFNTMSWVEFKSLGQEIEAVKR